MIRSLAVVGVLMSTAALAKNPAYEVCTFEGPCALRVENGETGEDLWLIKDSGLAVMEVWEGEFWKISATDYEEIKAMIPEVQRFLVPLRNPTTGTEAKGSSTTPSSSGPLVTGTVNVNVSTGGSNPCAPCHTGSMRDIHAEVLKKDPKNPSK